MIPKTRTGNLKLYYERVTLVLISLAALLGSPKAVFSVSLFVDDFLRQLSYRLRLPRNCFALLKKYFAHGSNNEMGYISVLAGKCEPMLKRSGVPNAPDWIWRMVNASNSTDCFLELQKFCYFLMIYEMFFA